MRQAFEKHTVTLPASLGGTELHFVSDTFVPGGTDDRTLGVAVSKAHIAGRTSATASDWPGGLRG